MARMTTAHEHLPILRCPITRSSLRELNADELATLNERVRNGLARTVTGARVDREIDDVVVSDSVEIAYPVEDGVYVLLADLAIEMASDASGVVRLLRGSTPLVRFGTRFIRASPARQIPISRFVADPTGEPSTVLLNGVPVPHRTIAPDFGFLRGQRLEPEKQTDVGIEARARTSLRHQWWWMVVAAEVPSSPPGVGRIPRWSGSSATGGSARTVMRPRLPRCSMRSVMTAKRESTTATSSARCSDSASRSTFT